MVEFIIDPEFRDKIPAMPQEDFDGLRADIIRDGYVRDPLVVWKEENILLDGHHRWRVISENKETLGDKFQVDYKSFPDRWAAIAWICANQLHKHNMTELQKMKLIQEEHDARQKSWGGDHGNQYTVASGQIGQLASDGPELVRKGKPGKENTTRPTIAKEHGISEKAVRTAVEVGRGIDRASEIDPEFKNDVLTGKVKVRKADLAAIRRMQSDEEVKEAVETIRDPSRKLRPMSPQMKDFTKKMVSVVEEMKDLTKERQYDLDDAIRDLNSAEDIFINQVEFVLDEHKGIISADERGKEQVIGFIESVISDLNNLKGRFI